MIFACLAVLRGSSDGHPGQQREIGCAWGLVGVIEAERIFHGISFFDLCLFFFFFLPLENSKKTLEARVDIL